MIPLEAALETVLAHAHALGAEELPLARALGRVLAEDARADTDLPPFARAAMDGFAVRDADLASVPVRLPIGGDVRAGQLAGAPLGPGEVVRITTGAPVPDGATAVVPLESTRLLGRDAVEFLERVPAGGNVVPAGSEARAGEPVLSRGTLLDPASIALLATVGRARVRVGRRPSLAVAVTGDEVLPAWASPAGGRIRDGNGPALEALGRAAGADVQPLGTVADDPERLSAAVRAGLEADVLALSGGVSAGAYDLVEEALVRLGVELLFTRVAVKPGAPAVFGRRGEKLVFGLPGNPVSAQVVFELLVRPALLKMQGARVLARPRAEAVLAGAVTNASGRRAHLPARLRFEGDGLTAVPVPSAGSGDVVALAAANGLVVLEPARTRAGKGERVEVVLLGNFLDRDGR